MRRVLCIVGTRPEAIKMAPVVHALRRRADTFETVVCATAQHRGMLDQVLNLFDLQPEHDLDLMRPDQSLCGFMSAATQKLEDVFVTVRPELAIVQGDTTSSLAGALAAFYHRVKVAHVEAGLRTGDLEHPFPEEMNRRLTDQLSHWLFPPTSSAREELLREGLSEKRMTVTGNTGIDALVYVRDRLSQPAWRSRAEAFARQHRLDGRRLVLVTGHRRENFGEPLRQICGALVALAARSDVIVVYPVHPNPNVQRVVREHLRDSNVRVTEPLDYALFVCLLGQASLILTDSGGIQEEATFLGIPTLVLRNTTERPEAVQAGIAKIVGTSQQRILLAAEELLDNPETHARMARPSESFGDGRAAERIASVLAQEGDLLGSLQHDGTGSIS